MKTKRQKILKDRKVKINKIRKKRVEKSLNLIKATQSLEGIIIGKDLEKKMIQLLEEKKTKEELMSEILKKYSKKEV